MNLPLYWPYILAAALLVAGLLTGWFLGRAGKAPRKAVTSHADEHPPVTGAIYQPAKSDLQRMDGEINRLTQAVSAARQQISDNTREYQSLLLTLDERRAEVEAARGQMTALQAQMREHAETSETLLGKIDAALEEIELLEQLKETYASRLNKLTQQAQWQDSELRMLRQTIKARTTEIDEARALLEQHDADHHRLTRQRQQREVDIAHVAQMLREQEEQLQTLLRERKKNETSIVEAQIVYHPSDPLPGRRGVAMLPSGETVSDPLSWIPQAAPGAPDDDLTRIPGLADLYARQLRQHGIRTFQQIAESKPRDIEMLLSIPGHFSPDIPGWIRAAQWYIRKDD
ncbi:MAG: hypothetical protein IT326_04940 [Anaerolineae bacterium]|nr:hypothetical protein [Anaerolineae bacterium]